MKRYIYTLCLMTMTLIGLSSCLGDSNSSDVTVYDDTAITAVSLTTVNRYIHKTTSAGKDTVYKSTLAVSNYPFAIDHYQRKIFTTDSLPSDCDLKHVILSVSTSTYSGYVMIKSLTSDSLFYYNSSDSIDLSQPREFRVYNNTMAKYRAYEVTVNAKKGSGDYFSWERLPDHYSDVPASIYQEVKLEKGSSATFRLSLDGGATWSEEQMGEEENPEELPDSALAYLYFPLDKTTGTDYYLLVGCHSSRSFMNTVWRKMTNDGQGKWVLMLNDLPVGDYYPGYLPASAHVSLINQGGVVLALLDDGQFYESRDQGLSWHKNTKYNLPADAGTDSLRAVGDEDGYVWLVNTSSGAVWRGLSQE